MRQERIEKLLLSSKIQEIKALCFPNEVKGADKEKKRFKTVIINFRSFSFVFYQQYNIGFYLRQNAIKQLVTKIFKNNEEHKFSQELQGLILNCFPFLKQ